MDSSGEIACWLLLQGPLSLRILLCRAQGSSLMLSGSCPPKPCDAALCLPQHPALDQLLGIAAECLTIVPPSMLCKCTTARTVSYAALARQAHVPIPDDAWEYHIRKSLNDAAYQGLEYVPYCTTMPVKANSEDVAFMWVRIALSSCATPDSGHSQEARAGTGMQ